MGLLAALSAAAVLAGVGGADTSPIFATAVIFRVTYRADCTFQVAIDGGISMDSATGTGATIPPGPYQLQLRTPLPDNMWNGGSCTEAQFSLSGPGVSYAGVVGTDSGPYSATFNETFAPDSTYTRVDASRPSAPVVFTTATTGSSSSLEPAPPASTASGSFASQDLVGSGIVPLRGTLQATVGAPSTATLTSGGKPLVSLKAGSYDIVVSDKSAKGGFFVQKLHSKPRTITGVTFRGKRTVRLNLTAGSWAYFSSSRRQTQFVVTR
jgi:hypothetical protein